MAFPYATKEAYELSDAVQELDSDRLQQYKTAGHSIGDGDCTICAQLYFVDSIHPILLHHDGSETLHLICNECYTTRYDDEEAQNNDCPYCRLELFQKPGEDVDDNDEDTIVVAQPIATPEQVLLTRGRISQIQQGEVHENQNLLDDRILNDDLRYIGRLHDQHEAIWWRNPSHADDEQALRTVLEHRAAVYMAGELNLSLALYDAAYEDGDDSQRVSVLSNPLNGSYLLEHSLDVDEISMVLRDGYYRRFLAANAIHTRGMITHPLAMQALRVIETTLRNERMAGQYHHPSAIYNKLCAELKTTRMSKVPQVPCDTPDCEECAELNERRVQGLETVVADMVYTAINVLRTGAFRVAPRPVLVTRRSAGGNRRDSKRRWRHNRQVSPSS